MFVLFDFVFEAYSFVRVYYVIFARELIDLIREQRSFHYYPHNKISAIYYLASSRWFRRARATSAQPIKAESLRTYSY